MDTLLQDLRYALRLLVKSPGFTAVALLTLGIGIGVNTAIFSVVNGVLLKPLPYDEPGRLVRIWETAPAGPQELRSIAHPTLDTWEAGLKSFEAIALYGPTSLALSAAGGPEEVQVAQVSRRFFSVLRVQPAVGRAFTAEEYQPHGPLAVILGDGVWRRRFGADRQVIGQTLSLDGQPYTIVGVL